MRFLYDGDGFNTDFVTTRLEAYWFAMGFLMPKGVFEAVMSLEGANAAARRFRVSLAMVSLRESLLA
jgi:hypothetical protein